MNRAHKMKTASGKMIVTFLLIAVQIVWFVLLFNQVVHIAGWVSSCFQGLSVVLAMYIVNKDDVAAYRMGWILLILIAPVFGGIIYLIWGDKRSSIFMRRKIDRGVEAVEPFVHQDEEVEKSFSEELPRAAGCAHYLSDYCGFPVWRNTEVKYYPLGDDQYVDMLEELKKAEKFIFVEYYIIAQGAMWSAILDILRQKAAEGVDVRVIYDDFGCLSSLPNNYNKYLESLGIKCLRFNPLVPLVAVVMNNRDHRKMLVIDGNVGFTGGLNLADEYINIKKRFGYWKDSGVMLKGDAVWNLTAMFLDIWYAFRHCREDVSSFGPTQRISSVGYVQPFYDSPFDYETITVNLYTDIITRARDYVYIFTPYLGISDDMSFALRNAARRGVDVRLVIPGIPDKPVTYRITRSYTIPLLRAGVRVYEYTPGFIHAKCYVCDDETAIVGTGNSDYRSLYLQFECGVMFSNCEAVLDLRRDAQQVFAVSHEVTLDERVKKGIKGLLIRALDSVLRVLAPLF